ncbi:hypothetical protein DV515_00013824 [Chloebia gouldiae]|uniref:Uncharacterized protein n=1 Tax=Chloebia gouldiae TaxID=44316 RepID=A0A3L8S187_CHLGU|nr:hypothetical protein DV515_00013824 [Chloebia gouldiae]
MNFLVPMVVLLKMELNAKVSEIDLQCLQKTDLMLVIMCVVTNMEYIGASEGMAEPEATEDMSDTQELTNHGWVVVPEEELESSEDFVVVA